MLLCCINLYSYVCDEEPENFGDLSIPSGPDSFFILLLPFPGFLLLPEPKSSSSKVSRNAAIFRHVALRHPTGC